MKLIRMRALVLLLGLLPLGALPQDESPGQGAAPAPRTEESAPAERPPARPQGDPGTQRPDPPPPPSARGAQRPSDDDGFVPTEELQADEEVTFPVDI
jgi:hypothetical protein